MKNKAWKALLDLLYPPRCAVCGAWLGRESKDALCIDCLAEWEKETAKTCRFCRRKHSACVCDERRMNGKVTSFHLIGYTNRSETGSRLVLVNKDRNLACVSDFLAEKLADRLNGRFDRVSTVVTYCPRKSSSRRAAGYDQAKVLAEKTAKKLSLPFEKLIRRLGGESQKDLSFSGRKKNADISYAFVRGMESDLKGKTVILIDDVSTSGATLDKCAGLLLENGADRIVYAYIAKSNKGTGKGI